MFEGAVASCLVVTSSFSCQLRCLYLKDHYPPNVESLLSFSKDLSTLFLTFPQSGSASLVPQGPQETLVVLEDPN